MPGVNGAVDLQAGSTVQLQIRAGGPSDAIVSNGAATPGGTAAFSDLGGVCAFNSEIVLLVAGVQLDEMALSARLDASLKLGKNVDLSVG